jgi:hypothetical protein
MSILTFNILYGVISLLKLDTEPIFFPIRETEDFLLFISRLIIGIFRCPFAQLRIPP